MIRPSSRSLRWLAVALTLFTGCHPTQPFYFGERGQLAHYVDVATQLEEPDVENPRLAEVSSAANPMTVYTAEFDSVWDLRLEEVIQIAASNNEIIRSLGGRIGQGPGAPETLLRNGAGASTTFDPAIQETAPGNSNLVRGSGAGSGQGVEAALAAFDAEFSMSAIWNQNDRPVNTTVTQIFQRTITQDQTTFQAQLSKFNALGGRTAVRHNVVYDSNNNPTRLITSDYNVNFEFEVRQPLLQGYGAEFNRIFGPSSDSTRDVGAARGVMIARINADIAALRLQTSVRDLVGEVEDAYWELYFAYRNLEVQKRGLAETRKVWKELIAKAEIAGGETFLEARARSQFYDFQGRVRQALASLYTSERRMRYLMGVAASDRRLLRPIDEPTTALVQFDYPTIAGEALTRSPELMSQKWLIRASEYNITAAKNFLLPRLDAVALYRFVGLGDDLISSKREDSAEIPGPTAWQSMTSGRFQEWTMGFTFELPIGFRAALGNVRHQQLGLIRNRKLLQEQELELVYQMQESLNEIARAHSVAESSFNAVAAANSQIDGLRSLPGQGFKKFDVYVVLNAYLEQAQAEGNYFRAVVDYNRALKEIHLRKGSLLEYNGITLTEGPWTDKAYYDAHGEARRRDAAHFLNYGFTQPRVLSRGPVRQSWGNATTPAVSGNQQPTPAILDSAPKQPQRNRPETLPEPKSRSGDTVMSAQPAAWQAMGAVGRQLTGVSGEATRASVTGPALGTSAYDWGEVPMLLESH